MMKEDKIFNNKFNSGDLEYEVFGKINIMEDFTSPDAFDEYNENKMQHDIYNIFISSRYYDEYHKPKKVPRSEVAEIFYYFESRLPESSEITSVDKFICVADFMNISYDVLYQELAPVYKEKLLRELDHKYAIFTKRKIKRLF
jgi:hypothetical protein